MNGSQTIGAAARVGVALIAAFGICHVLTPGIAQAGAVEDERGFYLGLKLAGSSLHADTATSVFFIKEDGGGAQLDIGYRFNPVFMLELVIGGAQHDTSDPLTTAQVGAIQLFGYYRFSPERSFRPYFKGGFGGYSLLVEKGTASARFNGAGLAFGVGFRYFLSPQFSLGLDVTHNMIQYDEAELSLNQLSYQSSIDEHGQLTTLGLAVGYSF